MAACPGLWLAKKHTLAKLVTALLQHTMHCRVVVFDLLFAVLSGILTPLANSQRMNGLSLASVCRTMDDSMTIPLRPEREGMLAYWRGKSTEKVQQLMG